MPEVTEAPDTHAADAGRHDSCARAGSEHAHRRPLERPVLTITGTVGLTLGSLAWLISGSAGAGWLVLAASLATAVALAFAVDRAVAAAARQIERSDLRTVAACGLCGPLIRRVAGVLAAAEGRAADARRESTEVATRLALARRRVRRLEAVLDTVELPLLVADDRGVILFRNRAADGLLPRDDAPEAAAGRRLDVLPALAELARKTYERRAASGRCTADFTTPAAAGGADGGTSWHAEGVSVTDTDGVPLGVSLIVRDATTELAEKHRHAEFISGVAHELKTPMAAIRAFTELLLDDDVESEGERREMYGVIDTQCERLTRLVTNMLSLARIESGVVEVRRRDVELNDVLASTLEVVRQLAEEKHITLSAELSDLYLAVNVDPDLFGQAVINLLSNAVKYTPDGGTVRLRSRMDGERAVVEVRDTGMGIPREDLDKIFDRFHRVEQNSGAAEGTGLGLSLVHSITAGLHDGSVTVESEVGVGSCFTLSIPFGHRDTRGHRGPAPVHATPANTGRRGPAPLDLSHA